MSTIASFDPIKDYFQDKLDRFGLSPRGVDWNSVEAQEARFDQLLKVVDATTPFSILDYGCGFGSLFDSLHRRGYAFRYTGYDLLDTMIEKAVEVHSSDPDCRFTSREEELQPCDYAVESGIFNIRLDCGESEWIDYVVETLQKMDRLSLKGFAFNLLTSYSDHEYMKPNLYYADPCFYFDYCKKHFSRNVALLHDYTLYDFTILVRKAAS